MFSVCFVQQDPSRGPEEELHSCENVPDSLNDYYSSIFFGVFEQPKSTDLCAEIGLCLLQEPLVGVQLRARRVHRGAAPLVLAVQAVPEQPQLLCRRMHQQHL